MDDTRARTLAYIDAFHARDLDGVAALMAEDVVLTDPEVTGLTPKAAVLDHVARLFAAHDRAFGFEAGTVVVEGEMAVIEFVLTLNETVLRGMDLIEWGPAGIRAMRAYLTAQPR